MIVAFAACGAKPLPAIPAILADAIPVDVILVDAIADGGSQRMRLVLSRRWFRLPVNRLLITLAGQPIRPAGARPAMPGKYIDLKPGSARSVRMRRRRCGPSSLGRQSATGRFGYGSAPWR